MKLNVEKRTFETFGTDELQESSFKVKQSREMFKLLSSNIYSDKVSAIIRELSANAIDAHVMSGNKDTPIEVHLPNDFEPFFYVKDFGTGLSEENIVNLYTTYGESTKTEDNESTGCFGIGSKSPFAYTDQFTITSRFNGTKYVFNCYVNDAGIPTVAKVSEDSTNEVNGLEIYFAVEESDFREFKDKAQEIYKYYLVQPNVVGVAYFDMNPLEIELEVELESGVKAYLLEDTYYEKAKAVQGACTYPIDRHQFESEHKEIYSKNMLIEFPLGFLNITASREHLEYDKHTVKVLQDTARDLVLKFAEEIQEKFNEEVTSEWTATKIADKLYRTMPMYNLVCDEVVWKKLPINHWRKKQYELDLREDKKETLEDGTERDFKVSYADIRNLNTDHRHLRSDSAGGKTALSPTYNGDIIIVVNTEGLRQFNPTLTYNFMHCVPDEYQGFTTLLFINPDKGYEKKTWNKVKRTYKDCDGVTIIRLKDLEEPPKAAKVKRERKKVLTLNGKRYSSNMDNWTPAEKTLDTGGIYVNISRFVPERFSTARDFSDFVDMLRESNIIPDNVKIFGIPASYKNIPDKYDGWINLWDFLPQKFDKRIKGLDIKKMRTLEYYKSNLNQYNEEVKLLKKYKDCAKDIQKGVDIVTKTQTIKISKDIELIDLYEKFQARLGKTTAIKEISVKETPFEKHLTKLKNRYKLLFSYGVDRYRSEPDPEFIEYINVMKSLKRRKKGTTNDTRSSNSNG